MPCFLLLVAAKKFDSVKSDTRLVGEEKNTRIRKNGFQNSTDNYLYNSSFNEKSFKNFIDIGDIKFADEVSDVLYEGTRSINQKVPMISVSEQNSDPEETFYTEIDNGNPFALSNNSFDYSSQARTSFDYSSQVRTPFNNSFEYSSQARTSFRRKISNRSSETSKYSSYSTRSFGSLRGNDLT